MDLLSDSLGMIGHAAWQLMTEPFYYAAILFIILLVRRQIFLQRQCFHSKLHAGTEAVLASIGWGLVLGVAVSIVIPFIGMKLSLETLLLLWGIALLLMLVRVRFLCFAYASGVIGIAHGLAALLPQKPEIAVLQWFIDTVMDADIPSLLALAALTHGAEAWLIRFQGNRMSTPLFVEGKRGKIIGAYSIQGYWPVPLLMLIPVIGDGGWTLPWTPLFGGAGTGMYWSLIAFPVLIGFSEMTTTMLPQTKARRTASRLLVYAVIVMGLALLSFYVTWFIAIAAALCILLHEAMLWISRVEEERNMPLFMHDSRGLRVLAILPDSPAEKMGIKAGEFIRKANGIAVRTKEELHQAIQINPAFCKLELMDMSGEIRYATRAVYAGEHHQLGVFLSPDERTDVYVTAVERPIWSYIRMALAGHRLRRPK